MGVVVWRGGSGVVVWRGASGGDGRGGTRGRGRKRGRVARGGTRLSPLLVSRTGSEIKQFQQKQTNTTNDETY